MKATLETINAMQAEGVIGKYAIGGAVGATFYLEPSATLDVDIFVALPTNRQGEHIIIGNWPVQFLPASDRLEIEALEQAVPTEVEGVRTWVMSAEHLVAIALRTGRSKDYARILQFVEAEAVDRTRLERLLIRHGLLSRWELFKTRYLEDSDG